MPTFRPASRAPSFSSPTGRSTWSCRARSCGRCSRTCWRCTDENPKKSGDFSRAPMSVWEIVDLARHQDRPYSLDYIRRLAPDFIELHGDRLSADDPALVGGVGTWHGRTTIFLGHQKGRSLKERVARNWGMMHPEGYRKALRLAHHAAKFGFPIISLIDTPGAYPGAGAEERGIAAAIANAIMDWFRIPVPIVAAVIGEGGSGGALG